MRKYLVEMRKSKNLTQLEISKRLKISESYYNLIENGARQKNMSVLFLGRIAEILGVSKNTLLKKETEYIKSRRDLK